jgi:dihydrofolate synthase / folylpolyglutamate synthase
VHVVGTDGKTSATRMMAAMLAAAGLRVGDTTSPHLIDVRERIRIDGRSLGDAALNAIAARLLGPIAEVDRALGEQVTFFEAVTATALLAFAEHEVDVAIVEAGIGGVGDATGALGARTVVLTTVGHDHPELGATLADVAREKAGVVAPGGTIVCAPQADEVLAAVDQVARTRGARVCLAGVDFGVEARRATALGQVVHLRAPDGGRLRVRLGVHGPHQARNAALALAGVHAHLGHLPDLHRLRAGLAGVRVPGRMEIVRRRGRVMMVLDGAHDATAAIALDAAVTELAGARPRVLVIGCGGGRDPLEVAGPLVRPGTRIVVTRSGARTASDVGVLAHRLGDAGLDAIGAVEVPDALALADALAIEDAVIVVTGSLYLVGEVAERVRPQLLSS